MRFTTISALMSAGIFTGCAMQPMTPEQQAYWRQVSLEQQRAANAQQLEATRAIVNQQRPSPQVQTYQPATLSAFWTGKSQFGQSVTGAAGMNCEYNYAGRTFWRMFAGGCPASVPVQ